MLCNHDGFAYIKNRRIRYKFIYSRLRLIGSLFKWVSRLIGPLLAGPE